MGLAEQFLKLSEEVVGYTASGEPINSTKKTEKKALALFDSEADKFVSEINADKKFDEAIKALFKRFALAEGSKFKKWLKDFKSFQGSDRPYRTNGKSFLVNFKYKTNGIIGSEAELKKAKTHMDDALNFSDTKYKVTIGQLSDAKEIYTSSDLIINFSYIKALKKDVKVFLVLQGGKKGFPSDLRLARAVKKLQDKDIEGIIVGDLPKSVLDKL